MEKIQIISNSNKTNHLDYILKYLAIADEVWIATAFLKNSGLALLLPAIRKHVLTKKPIQIIAGQNFGLTEPEALKTIHGLFNKQINACLYLNKADDKQSIFHPKLFVFRLGNKGIIITGSANITNGGLVSNEEVSTCIEVPISDPNWKQVLDYYTKITSVNNADLVSLMIINRYEQFYAEQKKSRERQKASPDKKTSEYSFDFVKLRKRLREYRKESYSEYLKQRIREYKKAKTLLEEIANSDRLFQSRFEELIDALVGKKGSYGLWRSGSLNRLRHEVYLCKKEFRKLVKFISDNQNLPATKVFNEAKRLVGFVHGARMNYVAEIMMTYQPERFANLNSNPISVLKEEAGVYFKSHSNSFSGEDYEAYCSVVMEICKELELKNMLEADSFFNEIYWKLKQEGKLR
jgi:HKD family nuclease